MRERELVSTSNPSFSPVRITELARKLFASAVQSCAA